MAHPERFAALKATIAATYPDFERNATRSWAEVLNELEKVTHVIEKQGSDYIPKVKFSELASLGHEQVENIKRKGCVVITDIVADEQAARWKEELGVFVQENPTVIGVPKDDKQVCELFWTKPQVEARSHANVLAATVWLNNLYRSKNGVKEGVDLSQPLTYADTFRIRKPGLGWNLHPPHIDGGTIERWEEPLFRRCFEDILTGDWRKHDPYELDGRLDARTSLYGRPYQSSVFRTFQGWLAMSETAPTEGTLRVFPDVLLSNAYIILRPFFAPTIPPDSPDIFKPESWKFDLSDPHFPGLHAENGGYVGPRPTPELHPHMRLETSVVSIPRVNPGDAVFWHCDVVHAVERDHTGKGDSAVMYIPAVPLTPQNLAYVERQKAAFLAARCPPDFPQGAGEADFKGIGSEADLLSDIGRRAMGFTIPAN